ncbi:hypothetical protein ACIP5Z_12130 [Rothia terrae]|jgi:hypothetical protein|nr:hypothetical protein [Rothia terrae]MDT0189528.1 hypothetical protein [Rothia terrae]
MYSKLDAIASESSELMGGNSTLPNFVKYREHIISWVLSYTSANTQ